MTSLNLSLHQGEDEEEKEDERRDEASEGNI